VSLFPEGLSLEVRCLLSLAEMEALAPSWERLAEACGAPPVAFPSFVLPWYRHRARRDRPVVLAVLDREGRAVGLLPLLVGRRRRGHLPVSVLQCATRNAWAPGVGALLDPAADRQLLADWLARRALDLPGWRIAEFFPLAPGEPFETALRREIVRRRLRATAFPPTASAEIVLAGGGDEDALLAPFTRGRRQRVRRGWRRIDRGELAVREVRSPRALGEALDDVFSIALESWQGQQGTSIASSPESRAFYREACLRLAREGRFLLGLLIVDGRPIAFDLQAVLGDRAWSFHRGFVPDRARLGPGVVLLGELLRRHARRGVRSCELFQPATDDKRRWNPRLATWHGLRIFARRPAAGLLGRLDEVRRVLFPR